MGPVSFACAQEVTGVISIKAAPTPPTTVVVQGDKKHKTTVWFRAESQHFIVYSNTSHSAVTTLLYKMEKFRYVLRVSLRLDAGDDEAPKTELYYLGQDHDLDTADPRSPPYAIGLYKDCESGSQAYGVHMYYTESLKLPLEKQPENEGLSYIYQAYARHFFYQNSFLREPLWFIDGYAQYFSTTRFDGNQAVIGMPPEAIGSYLSMLGRDVRYSLDYKDILLGKVGDGRARLQLEFEARAWVLTHYILSFPGNRRKFEAYMADVENGEAPVAAFEKAFGFKASQIHEILFHYVHGGLAAEKLNFKALPSAEVSFTTLSASAEHLLLWQSALQACAGPVYGHILLKKIREEAPKFPESELAQIALSRAEIQWGDPQSALTYLHKIAHNAPADFEAQHLLGQAELALAEKAGIGQADAMLGLAQQAFLAASNIDAHSASNAYGYYRASILKTGVPDNDGLAAAVLAWQLAPATDSYAVQAGLVYAYLGRKAEALQALASVANNPRDPYLAPVATLWIRRIGQGVTQEALLDAMRAGSVLPDGGSEDWTIASAAVVRDQRAAAAAQDAAAAMGGGKSPGIN